MKVDKVLLMNWWNNYYAKEPFGLSKLKDFERIIDVYGIEKVISAGVASYIILDGSPYLILLAIRKNNVERFFNDIIPDFSEMKEEERKLYEIFKVAFIKNILK